MHLSPFDQRMNTYSVGMAASPRLLRSGVSNGEVPVVHERRKLAAIVASDVVGYTTLTAAAKASIAVTPLMKGVAIRRITERINFASSGNHVVIP